ncbi:transcription regulator domain protein [Ralstonia pickettii]|nr:transcription regulator domain protein [Ralstonia pickettii]
MASEWTVARNRRECRSGFAEKSINLLSYIRHKTFYKRAGRLCRFCGEIGSYVEHTQPSIRCDAAFRRRRRRIARFCGRRRRLSHVQSAVSADQDADPAKPASRRMEARRNDPQ